MAGNIPVQREAHPDVPLANLALQAFEAEGDYIATQLIPAVTVTNETDQFYVLDADSWLRIENTRRSRLVAPREVEWKVGSDNYVVKNYALANKIAFEDLANADRALALRENATRFVVQMLLRDQEDRIARLVTSGTNLGSYVSLSGVNKWSDYINSDPISDVNTAQAFIRGITGMTANVIALDYDTVKILQRHPVILDAAIGPGRTTGLATDQQLAALFGVERVLVGKAIKQNAVENATASYTNIWGNNAVLAHVEQGVGLQTATFGLRFVWQPENFPAPFQVFRSEDPIPGVNAEIILAGYFQDEKVVAKNLSYGILSTL